MATEQSRTTSNRVEISDPDAVEKLLEDWSFVPNAHGCVPEVTVTDGQLSIFGTGRFDPYPQEEVNCEDGQYDHIDPEAFLEALAPYLCEDLVIQTVSNIKCRFPFSAFCYIVDADQEEVTIRSLNELEEDVLGERVSG